MQRSSSLQLVRSLRSSIRPQTRRYAQVPAPEPGFPTGEEFLAKAKGIKHHAVKTTALWRNISFFVCIPTIVGGSYWVIETEKKHAEHKEAHPHEYVEYPYLNRRTHAFPWGPNSLFFNPHSQKDMSEA